MWILKNTEFTIYVTGDPDPHKYLINNQIGIVRLIFAQD